MGITTTGDGLSCSDTGDGWSCSDGGDGLSCSDIDLDRVCRDSGDGLSCRDVEDRASSMHTGENIIEGLNECE